MNLSERKKMQRRLPLWESAIMNADKNDFEGLKKKIDNARNALKMPPFDYSGIWFPGVKNREVITEKEVRTTPGLRSKVKKGEKEYSYLEVAEMKNKLKMSDEEIAQKLKMGMKAFNNYKREYFKETFRLRDDSPLTLRRYCNIKNETNMNDDKIKAMYGIKSRDTMTNLRKKVAMRYVIRDTIDIFSEDYQIAKNLCKLYNKNGLTGRQIASMKGVHETLIHRLKERLLKKEYYILDMTQLTPEIYCHLRNDLLMTDQDIMKKYNFTCRNRLKRLRDKYLENHFEVLENI